MVPPVAPDSKACDGEVYCVFPGQVLSLSLLYEMVVVLLHRTKTY
jgi:hypothetical protein